jgi:hypothetical protein
MAIKIGINATILASKASLDTVLGQKVSALRRALRDLADFKLLLDQVDNPYLVSLGYDGGADGNGGEVNYVRSILFGGKRLYDVSHGVTPDVQLPFDFDAEFRYAAATI